MTHGEIRGTLVLLALMSIVVIFAYLTRSGRQDSVTTRPTTAELDSIRLEHTASRLEYRDSIRKANDIAPEADDITRKANVATTRGDSLLKRQSSDSRHHKRKNVTPAAPAPSPLERPVNP